MTDVIKKSTSKKTSWTGPIIREVVTYLIGYLFDAANRMPRPQKIREANALRQAGWDIRKCMAKAGITATHEPPPKKRMHLVIGLYDENQQRFADEVEAKTPKEAEDKFSAAHPDVTVAGIVTGIGMEVVDSQD